MLVASFRGGLSLFAAILIASGAAALASKPWESGRLDIADMTWVELRQAIDQGYTTVIVPSGGIEENGPHMVLGKHDEIVRRTSRDIARALGNALVAPVISFVPEGDPGTGLMQFPGTIGVPEEVFAGVLEGVARSLRQSGFKNICLIADHGGSVGPQAEVASRLTREWAADGVRVFDISDYYGSIPAQNDFLKAQGETPATIGEHAGIVDTSELMAINPKSVDLSRYDEKSPFAASGVIGNPKRASAERGQALLAIKIEKAIKQIKALVLQPAAGAYDSR